MLTPKYVRAILLAAIAMALATSAAGQLVEKTLTGNAWSGVTPGPDGRLYGVTYESRGGTVENLGSIYSVDANLASNPIHHYIFTGGADGAIPYSDLTFDPVTGKFYGTTDRAPGTVFSYSPGASSITTLRSDFKGYRSPVGPLVVSGGYIFGPVNLGNAGAIFRMAMDGSGFEIIHAFAGAAPDQLSLGPDGKLYGVTPYGGIFCPSELNRGCGTIFRLRRVLPGDTDVQFETIFQFRYYSSSTCPPNDTFCVPSFARTYNFPIRSLIFGSDGLVYGQTFQRVFRFNPASPASTMQFIGGLHGGVSLSTIEGGDGRLYVVDYGGGAFGVGEVYSMNRDGTNKTILRTFSHTTGSTANGPYGRLYRSPAGVVYGTTEYTNIPPTYNGTVYAIGLSAAKLKVAGGNILIGSPGQGLILRSPNGTACAKLSINNDGDLVSVPTTCPK